MRFSGRRVTHGSATMMRADKIQVNQRIYVKDFIGDPDKMAGGHFSVWTMYHTRMGYSTTHFKPLVLFYMKFIHI